MKLIEVFHKLCNKFKENKKIISSSKWRVIASVQIEKNTLSRYSNPLGNEFIKYFIYFSTRIDLNLPDYDCFPIII